MAKRKFDNGVTVTITGDTSSHRQPLGTNLTIKGKQNGYYTVEELPNVYFLPADLEAFACTVESLEKQIGEMECEIAGLRSKINYLKETGESTFCPKQFKAYQTLKLLADDSNMTLLEKAKKVAELYN
jgi:hypothetical protein